MLGRGPMGFWTRDDPSDDPCGTNIDPLGGCCLRGGCVPPTWGLCPAHLRAVCGRGWLSRCAQDQQPIAQRISLQLY